MAASNPSQPSQPAQPTQHHGNDDPQVPAYDPAFNTLHFDILAVLSAIYEAGRCTRCTRHLIRTAERALGIILKHHDPPITGASPSHVKYIRVYADTAEIMCSTTVNPTELISVRDADRLRNHYTRSSLRESLVDGLLEPLFQAGDDTFNLDQTLLWYCLWGKYTVTDAVHGRSLSEYARAHMQLMTNIVRYRRQHPRSVHLSCDCFGMTPEMLESYLSGADATRFSEAAVSRALASMDGSVAAIVKDQRRRPWEWPEKVRPGVDGKVGDWLVVLDAFDKMPAFQARLRALGTREQHRREERRLEDMAKEWRENIGWRIATMEWRVAEVEDTRTLLEELVQKLVLDPLEVVEGAGTLAEEEMDEHLV
jgi:hypothetical protein